MSASRIVALCCLLLMSATVYAGDVWVAVQAIVKDNGMNMDVQVTGGSSCGGGTVYGAFDRQPNGGDIWGALATYGFGVQCWPKGAHTVNVVLWSGTLQADGSCLADSAQASAGFQIDHNGSLSPMTNADGTINAYYSTYGCTPDGIGGTWMPTDKSPSRTGDFINVPWPQPLYNWGFGTSANDADLIFLTLYGCGDPLDEGMVSIPWKDLRQAPKNECRSCPSQPIKVTNGNMRASDRDPLPGSLERTYNSMRSAEGRWFGNGWSSPFDAYLRTFIAPNNIPWQIIGTSTGDTSAFRAFTQFYPPGPEPATLTQDATTGLYAYREWGSDMITFFNGDGSLAKTRSVSTGRETVFTFVSGAPTRVADSWGNWAWNVTTSGGRITSIAMEGTPIVWNYTYDANGNLTTIDVNGNVWRTNAYSGSLLTQISDAAGNLIEGHSYSGNAAISSTGRGSDDVQNITWSPKGGRAYTMASLSLFEDVTTITWKSGATTTYYNRGPSWPRSTAAV
jgi:hypothetical protein